MQAILRRLDGSEVQQKFLDERVSVWVCGCVYVDVSDTC